MAPQPPAKTPAQIAADAAAAESRQRTEENAEAVIGTEEDSPRRTETEQLDQNATETGVTRREPIKRPATSNDMRDMIAARFRRTTPENERPFNGDMTDQENVIGELGQNLEGRNPDDDDDLEREAIRRAQLDGTDQLEAMLAGEDAPLGGEETQPAPTRRKVKVRGQEMDLTDEEILEAARRTLAGDSYMQEARTLLEEAKRIRAGTALGRSPTGDQNGADDLDLIDPDTASPTEPTFRDVVEKIQFGDPEEAATQLETLVNNRAKKQANEGQLQRAFDQDFARSQKALKAFQDANADLANDEISAMAIETTMYSLYRDDMKALGLSDDQIPKDRSTIANWHRFYRINGYEVRPTSALLEAAKDKFVKWRGNKGQQGQQGQQQTRKAPPNVQVSVNRDTRRAAIPLQPSRSTTLRRDPQPSTQPRTRTDVFMDMKRARGQITQTT